MDGAHQLCEACGSPLRPCKCDRTKEPKPLRARPFRETRTAERYGPLFERIRKLRCWLAEIGYTGPGHEACGPGVQGGHTAHHVGRFDHQGLLPGCGRAHDLYAGLGGRTTVKAFRSFLDHRGLGLNSTAKWYVETFQ